VTDIMSEIVAASVEQASGIEQVNHAMTQMDTVTQQNASLVEEAAAAAHAMEEQADRLAKVVSVFVLSADQRQAGHGGASRAEPRHAPVLTLAARR
jgi:methyl-accepting chemotaxis protein